MSEHPIPAPSLQRLAVALQAYQELAKVVAEAMGLGDHNVRLELDRGVFVDVAEGDTAPSNGVAHGEVERVG